MILFLDLFFVLVFLWISINLIYILEKNGKDISPVLNLILLQDDIYTARTHTLIDLAVENTSLFAGMD